MLVCKHIKVTCIGQFGRRTEFRPYLPLVRKNYYHALRNRCIRSCTSPPLDQGNHRDHELALLQAAVASDVEIDRLASRHVLYRYKTSLMVKPISIVVC